MIRYIDLGDQTGNVETSAGEREFAFFDTVTDRFLTFSGSQTWTSEADFIADYADGPALERFLRLIPDRL